MCACSIVTALGIRRRREEWFAGDGGGGEQGNGRIRRASLYREIRAYGVRGRVWFDNGRKTGRPDLEREISQHWPVPIYKREVPRRIHVRVVVRIKTPSFHRYGSVANLGLDRCRRKVLLRVIRRRSIVTVAHTHTCRTRGSRKPWELRKSSWYALLENYFSETG